MSPFQSIYNQHADDYHALVSREDYQGNILRHLAQIAPLNGIDVVEFGAGTGRLSLLMAPQVQSLVITDASAHMLSRGAINLRAARHQNWRAVVADSRHAPLADACADLSVAGWCYGHTTEWHAGDWQTKIGRSVDEMLRVLRPGGMAVVFETMGTGTDTPAPPNTALAAYYAWLREERGFASAAFRTDYKFASLGEAERLTRFFFGDELAERVRAESLVMLPECTGVWWRRV